MYHVRWMIRPDLRYVLPIERDGFDNPMDEEDFLRCLRKRNCIGMVAESQAGGILGYMVYELRRDRIQVLSLAVALRFRRLRVGATLVDKLKYKCCSHRRERLSLLCRDSNAAAHLFFRACGFKAKGVLRNWYDDSGDEAYVFEWKPQASDYGPDGAPVNRIAQYEEQE